MADAVAASESRPPEFLAAWKAGVELIGRNYFLVTSASVAEATDKFQLRPDFGVIAHALQALSGGQSRFLIAMCQFYSDSEIATICRTAGVDLPSLADLTLLDDPHRGVIVRLIESYTGW